MAVSWPWAEELWKSIAPIYGVIGVLCGAGLFLILLLALIITCCKYSSVKGKAKKTPNRSSSRSNIPTDYIQGYNTMEMSDPLHRPQSSSVRRNSPPPQYPGDLPYMG